MPKGHKGVNMNTDIVVKEQSPSEIIHFAIEKGASLEQVEKALAIQERWEALQARKAYNEAMTAFKATPPKIDKDKTVSYGNTKYNHASLSNVTEKISAELSKHGLSVSWRVAQNGLISVSTRISHTKGHFEETTLTAPADNSGSKNSIQAIGSTISYLERYGLLALTGLATHEMDDDGQAAVSSFISDKELSQLVDLIAEKEINVTKFCDYLKIESLDKLPKAKYQQAIEAVNAKKKVSK